MANDKNFVIKNGLQAGRYLQTGGTETASTGPAYDLSATQYDDVSFSAYSQDASTFDHTFNNDGTKMYVVGFVTDSVIQYSLSTAFDLSTASYDNIMFSVASQDSSATGLAFNNSGTKMYIVGLNNDRVYQYSLSTAFDVSTASYDSVSFSVASQDTNPYAMTFNNDGTKMYIVGTANDSVHQYSLSTAFDLSTASYDSVSFSVASQEVNPYSITFKPDGTKMYITGSDSNKVHQYSLSTAFDLSTASYDSVSVSVAGQSTSTQSVVFNNDGTKMYIASNNNIYQYTPVSNIQTLDLSTGTYFSLAPSGAITILFTNAPASGKAVGFAVEINGDGNTITWPSSVKWHGGTAPATLASKEMYVFVTTDGGTTYYGKKAGEDIA